MRRWTGSRQRRVAEGIHFKGTVQLIEGCAESRMKTVWDRSQPVSGGGPDPRERKELTYFVVCGDVA